MRTMLVTVAGPSARRDLSLPADAPVAELLPVLVRLVGGDRAGADGWTLAPAGGTPLAGDASLAASGVLHGALLQLDAARPPPATPAAPPAPPPPPPLPSNGRTPAERTAAVLPLRHPLPERATLAAQALVASPPALTAAPLERLRQARQVWRSTSYLQRLDDAVRRPRLAWPVTIAVAAAQPRVGATTVTGLLGTLLALLRDERVVAVDAAGSDRPGSLGHTLGLDPEPPAGGAQDGGAGDLLARLARAMPAEPGLDQHVPTHGAALADDLVARLAMAMPTQASLDAGLGRAVHGLTVLPAPARRAPLDECGWRLAIDRLSSLYPLVLLDCGTGLANQPLARACDQLVLVTDADPEAASLAVEAALPLSRAGLPITVVVNRMPGGGGRLNLERLGGYLPGARGLVTLPDAPAAADELTTGAFSWSHAPAGWRGAVRELAACLAADWPHLGPTAPPAKRP